MDGGVIKGLPPEDAYLASHYQDQRRQFETQRVYYEDGRVEAFDGREWWRVCQFSAAQVAQAKAAIQASGLLSASDVTAEDVYDTAVLTYAWRLEGQHGAVTNWAYPARSHPAFTELEEQLDRLEAEAGAE
jgi:hypothetical protein